MRKNYEVIRLIRDAFARVTPQFPICKKRHDYVTSVMSTVRPPIEAVISIAKFNIRKYHEVYMRKICICVAEKNIVVCAIYLPYCAARSSADSPRLLRILGSHPYCNSCATTSVCPYCAAQCNAVSLSFVCNQTIFRAFFIYYILICDIHRSCFR